jgi:Variant SH3 domain
LSTQQDEEPRYEDEGDYYNPLPSPESPLLDETMRVMSEYVLAMHDFSPQQQNATCLSFRAGQVIHVLNRDTSGWWDGELEGRRGWFPSNYVNADIDVMESLRDEELPSLNVGSNIFRRSHMLTICFDSEGTMASHLPLHLPLHGQHQIRARRISPPSSNTEIGLLKWSGPRMIRSALH